MRLDDLLQVMRDEFAQAADDIDARLLNWFSQGAALAEQQAQAVAEELDRIAQTARVIALDGLALAVDQLRDNTLALAMLDEATMGEGLTWLVCWREPFQTCFDKPGDAAAAEALLAYLQQAPLAAPAAPDDALGALRELLVRRPEMPASGQEENAHIPQATAEDVSLEVPADVDRDLFETFLADAPTQLAKLAEAVAALVRGELPLERLQEAQRVAHTFKGSGNIVGVRGVGRLAHRIEDLIEFAAEHEGRLPDPMAHDLEQATATLDQMLFFLRGEEELPADAQARLQALLDWINAIHEDRWEALALERAAARPAPVSRPVGPRAGGSQPAANAVPPDASAEAATQLRIDVSLLDRLVRRAGQDLVRGGRVNEHVKAMAQRLHTLEASNVALQQRMAELQVAIERQGVSLNEKVSDQGGGFDPLEMDRYNQLHTISRFVAELVADETEMTLAALQETRTLGSAVREHGLSLKEQYRELMSARMVPFSRSVARLRRTVTQTAGTLGRQVRLQVEGDATQLDSDVLERLTEPLLHLLRNAVDHGIEAAEDRVLMGKPEEGTILLRIRRDGQTVQVVCQDDGQGINLHAVHAKALELGLVQGESDPTPQEVARWILLPGFSTRDVVTEVSGRGVGMDVVAQRVRAMKGHLDIASQPMEGTTVTLRVPATTGAIHALLVEAAGQQYALATDNVVAAVAAGEGRFEDQRFHHDNKTYAVARLSRWVNQDDGTDDLAARPVVLVRGEGRTVALSVDKVIDARELVLQDSSQMLRRANGVAGTAFRTDGKVLFVLDPASLDDANRNTLATAAVTKLRQRAQARRSRILVVDDAISVRKALSQLLQDAGFEVHGARDGFDALQWLEAQTADLVLTDLEMPNLNGLDFTRLMRQRADCAKVPVVMITSRSTQKHRDAAEKAGVNLYLTKPYTDGDLLGHVRHLLKG